MLKLGVSCSLSHTARRAKGEDDIHDLQGFWRLPVWVESSGFDRGTDGFNSDCMVMYCKESDAKALVASVPVQLPREDCSAAAEVVGTLTGSDT